MHAKPCPSCGYCPTCGRRNFSPWPIYPQPTWVPPQPWGTGGGNYTTPIKFQVTSAGNYTH